VAGIKKDKKNACEREREEVSPKIGAGQRALNIRKNSHSGEANWNRAERKTKRARRIKGKIRGEEKDVHGGEQTKTI